MDHGKRQNKDSWDAKRERGVEKKRRSREQKKDKRSRREKAIEGER